MKLDDDWEPTSPDPEPNPLKLDDGWEPTSPDPEPKVPEFVRVLLGKPDDPD